MNTWCPLSHPSKLKEFSKFYFYWWIVCHLSLDSDMENASSNMDESCSSFLLNEDSISSMDIDINALEKVWFYYFILKNVVKICSEFSTWEKWMLVDYKGNVLSVVLKPPSHPPPWWRVWHWKQGGETQCYEPQKDWGVLFKLQQIKGKFCFR